jgi:hypothetical protein
VRLSIVTTVCILWSAYGLVNFNALFYVIPFLVLRSL